MGGPGYRPATARDLERLLRLDRSRRHEFKRILKALLNDDLVVKIGSNRYALRAWATSREASRREGASRRPRGRDEGPQPARAAARGQKILSGRSAQDPR